MGAKTSFLELVLSRVPSLITADILTGLPNPPQDKVNVESHITSPV